jgi:hypothetical protein
MATTDTPAVREGLRRLADELPEGATWEDVIYEVYVLLKIDRGIADMEAGRTYSMEEIKREFGLHP